MLEYTIKTPPASEPITNAELGSWLRGVDAADAALPIVIKAARQFVEEQTNRAIGEQTLIARMDEWPVDRNRGDIFASASIDKIELPRAPLTSISEVRTFDSAGTAVPFTHFEADTISEPGRLVLKDGNAWPSIANKAKGVEIEYVCGYNDLTNDAPDLKVAIMNIAAHFYENREAVGEMSLSEAPMSAQKIIMAKRIRPGI